MDTKPFVSDEDLETAVGAVGRFVLAAPRLVLWTVLSVAFCLYGGERDAGLALAALALIWALLYALPITRPAARWSWLYLGPAADALRLRVTWEKGSRPDYRARRKGSAMVRALAPSARDDGQSIKHTNPNGSVRYTDPRGVGLKPIPRGVRLIASPTARHTAEGLAGMQDRYASRLKVGTSERLVATVLDQKRVAFDWEYLDPYEGTRSGAAVAAWDADGGRGER